MGEGEGELKMLGVFGLHCLAKIQVDDSFFFLLHVL